MVTNNSTSDNINGWFLQITLLCCPLNFVFCFLKNGMDKNDFFKKLSLNNIVKHGFDI